MKRAALSTAVLVLVAACSLESKGRDGDAGADGGACTHGPCTNALPPGFVPILVADTESVDCPAGTTEKDYQRDPVVGAGACDCACTVTTLPTCDMGSLHRDAALDSSCAISGFTIANPTGCMDRGTSIILGSYGKVAPLAPSGSPQCSAALVKVPDAVKTGRLRTCGASACAEALCAGPPSAGFRACVAGPDGATCPSSYPQRIDAGEGTALECSACGCTVKDARCENPAIDWYSDSACTKLVGTSKVTGSCDPEPDGTLGPSHLRYRATPKADCAATGDRKGTATLTGKVTVCCKG